MAGSVTQWLLQLRAGDRAAAQPIWERYFARLVRLARTHLSHQARRVADEEDVVICAFDSFCRGAEVGRFPQLDDSHDLWRVLVTITERKAINQLKHAGRQKRNPNGSSVSFDEQEHSPAGPSPWFCARAAELYVELLAGLRDEALRTIAVMKLEGYSTEEIAAKLECSTRTVERKLSLIREQWLESNSV